MTMPAVASAEYLLEVRELKKYFPVTKGLFLRRKVAEVKAVDGVSFGVRKGETLGIVGESGCGKTTIGRCILKLDSPTDGSIHFAGQNIAAMDGPGERRFKRQVQAVFQDPYGSLNPRMRVEDIVAEPLIIHNVGDRAQRREEVIRLLDLCGLARSMATRYPHEMSGGQRQRVGIARALALKPELLVCDEAVSALDVSIQAQVINLLEELRQELGLTYVFIGHDLAVVHHICQRIAVLYLGKLVELASAEGLFSKPRHPYTRALLEAVPVPDPKVEAQRSSVAISGEVPSPLDPPSGCVFRTRCRLATERCANETPELRLIDADDEMNPHAVACPLV